MPRLQSIGYHIVNVLPIIEGNQLERGQHGPHEIIEARVPVVRIIAYTQARVSCNWNNANVRDHQVNKGDRMMSSDT